MTRSRARALAAAGSGVLFAAATPPLGFLVGIFLGLGLFSWALDDELVGRAALTSGALRGFLFGLFANLVALRFVPGVIARFTPLPFAAGGLALVLLAAAQALPWALGGAAARALATRARVVAPLAFAIGVYVATFVPAVFPWTPAAGIAPWPALLQSADAIGERGVSLVLAAVCAFGAHGVARRTRRPIALSASVLLVVLGSGWLAMRRVERARERAPHAKIALVQPSFDASDRWERSRARMMLDRLTRLTKSAESRGAALTVWPESAYPFTLAHGARREPGGARAVLQPGVHGPVLTGAYTKVAGGLGYNSAVLVARDGSMSPPYDKRHLLWFGETVPLADTFPWLREVFARGTGLAPGDRSVAMVSGPVRAAVLNCYEDTLPAAGREAMEVAPNLLVNITNDAWFAGSGEGELHLRLSVLRAIETRRDLVRAVNRGPTSFVDATGRVRARYDGAIAASVPVEPALLSTPPTLYVRFGDAPLAALVVLSVAAPLAYDRRRRRA